TTTILPYAAVTDFSKIVKLKLFRLPLLPPKEVLQGLTASLQPFGYLLDVVILTNKATRYFMGVGYAVLDTGCHSPGSDNVSPIHTLSHVINWCESTDSFLATWNNMPTWCRHCHKEGHTKFECAESKANLICYNCHQKGHRSFECPRKAPPTGAPNKKARKTPEA
ncbi:MAG: hypothetical protein EXX96DRAFT_465565, partial [Benjaminiella poitrasii]